MYKVLVALIRDLFRRQAPEMTNTPRIRNKAAASPSAPQMRTPTPIEQTPVHELHNAQLLGLIPRESREVIEIGCSSGALAREFKKINPACRYIGIDMVQDYVELARRYCDAAYAMNIEEADDRFFATHAKTDCWVLADVLEHLYDPWSILSRIRSTIPRGGCVCACIPNAQHWSMIAKLSFGDFRYEDIGLYDRTHIRWFTRKTIIQMFETAGFEITEMYGRIFDEPDREKFLRPIGELAKTSGADPDVAINDAIPLQYVLRAIPR